MSQNQLDFYISFLDFISFALGEYFEVVLHDLSKPNNTVIAIRNGHITNRNVGDTLSTMTMSVISSLKREDELLKNYKSNASFRVGINSEDFIIRDINGQPIGLFCINYNTKMLTDARNLINSFFNPNKLNFNANHYDVSDNNIIVTNGDSFMEIAETLIDEVISESSVEPSRMMAEEKMEVIKKLYNKGVFQLKNIIGLVASKLCVSEATVYRYLSNI